MTTRGKRQTNPDAGAGSQRVANTIRLLQTQLTAAAARIAEAGVEDVHRGRVAARRLRSLLKTYGPLLDARQTRLYRVDLRSFARTLAAVREADVIGEVLLELARPAATLKATELQRLTVLLEGLRTEARNRLGRHLQEPGWNSLVAALAAHATRGPIVVNADASLADLLQLTEHRWRTAGRLLERHPESSSEWHELRLALKHCRYALEAVADIRPQAASRLLRRLRTVQDRIGRHRDTLAAQRWVTSSERSLGRATGRRLAALLGEHEGTLREEAAERCARVLPAYRGWRAAIRPLMQGTGSSPA